MLFLAAVDSWARGVPEWHLCVALVFMFALGVAFGLMYRR